MERKIKKNIAVVIFAVILIDIVIGYSLLKNRSFSHLAIWSINESNKQNDFYWPPENAPEYFHFEQNSNGLAVFRSEIAPLIKNAGDEFEVVLKVVTYLKGISSDNRKSRLSLKWDSPKVMLKQIKEDASANCFHRSILLSSYLSSLGIKSRLWALENEEFNATAHTVTEVYIKNFKKWVFIDATLDFYVTENGKPLSLLELREKLLDGNSNTILLHNIRDSSEEKSNKLPAFYSRLIKCVFLRADNDFVNKYNTRYGVFHLFQRYIDRLPDRIRRGLDYLLAGRYIFIHYVDRFSRSLGGKIITAKLLFYFSIFSLGIICGFLLISSLLFLKRYLATNLSKKDTCHK